MRFALTVVGLAAALVLIAASCGLNYTYWSAQAQTAQEGLVLGAVSVAVDLLKAMLPIYIAFALRSRHLIYAGLAASVFVVFVAASLVSALGFISMTRGAKVSSHEALTARYDLTKRELAELDAKLVRITGGQPLSVVEARLRTLRQDRRWRWSRQCKRPQSRSQRTFCTSYSTEREHLAAAVAANHLETHRSALRNQLSRLRDAGADQAADPQASLLSRILPGVTLADAKLGLMVFFAILVEIGASFGLYLSTAHSPTTRLTSWRRDRANRGLPVDLQTAPETTKVNLQSPTAPVAVIPAFRKADPPKRPVAERFEWDEAAEAWSGGGSSRSTG